MVWGKIECNNAHLLDGFGMVSYNASAADVCIVRKFHRHYTSSSEVGIFQESGISLCHGKYEAHVKSRCISVITITRFSIFAGASIMQASAKMGMLNMSLL